LERLVVLCTQLVAASSSIRYSHGHCTQRNGCCPTLTPGATIALLSLLNVDASVGNPHRHQHQEKEDKGRIMILPLNFV